VTGDYFVNDYVVRELEMLGASIHFKPLFEDDLVAVVDGPARRCSRPRRLSRRQLKILAFATRAEWCWQAPYSVVEFVAWPRTKPQRLPPSPDNWKS